MHHFGPYRNGFRICITAFAAWLLVHAAALAEEERPTIETRLGVADVERILQSYWRVPRARAELERYKTSEAFRQQQMEVARLEKELAAQRFTFFQRKRTNRKIQEERDKLQAMAATERERAREREKEAIEELLTDIRRAAESIGREQEIPVIFDSNTPHILFLNTYATGITDVTDAAVENLNFR